MLNNHKARLSLSLTLIVERTLIDITTKRQNNKTTQRNKCNNRNNRNKQPGQTYRTVRLIRQTLGNNQSTLENIQSKLGYVQSTLERVQSTIGNFAACQTVSSKQFKCLP